MNKIINLKPEALEMVNRMCAPGTLEDKITILEAAEDSLQEMACGQSEAEAGYNLYDVAYTLKRYRKELIELKNMIEDNS